MLPLDMKKVESYISDNIDTDFFDKKIAKLKNFTLSDVVKRKNPYLFKAKRIESAQDYIQQVLDATVSSGKSRSSEIFLKDSPCRSANKFMEPINRAPLESTSSSATMANDTLSVLNLAPIGGIPVKSVR